MVRINKKFRATFDVHNVQMDFTESEDEMPQYKFKTKDLVRIYKKFRASFDVHNVQMDFTESENVLYPQGRDATVQVQVQNKGFCKD